MVQRCITTQVTAFVSFFLRVNTTNLQCIFYTTSVSDNIQYNVLRLSFPTSLIPVVTVWPRVRLAYPSWANQGFLPPQHLVSTNMTDRRI